MEGWQVALEVLKYVIPLLLTGVMSLAVGHFRSLQRRVDEAQVETRALKERIHRDELQQTEDRAAVEVKIRTAVAEIMERFSSKFVPMSAYLTSQVQIDQKLDRLETKMDEVLRTKER